MNPFNVQLWDIIRKIKSRLGCDTEGAIELLDGWADKELNWFDQEPATDNKED